MNGPCKRKIEKCFSSLLDTIHPDTLADKLLTKGVITGADHEQVVFGPDGSSKKAARFLIHAVLKSKHRAAYDLFYDALGEDECQHITKMLDELIVDEPPATPRENTRIAAENLSDSGRFLPRDDADTGRNALRNQTRPRSGAFVRPVTSRGSLDFKKCFEAYVQIDRLISSNKPIRVFRKAVEWIEDENIQHASTVLRLVRYDLMTPKEREEALHHPLLNTQACTELRQKLMPKDPVAESHLRPENMSNYSDVARSQQQQRPSNASRNRATVDENTRPVNFSYFSNVDNSQPRPRERPVSCIIDRDRALSKTSDDEDQYV